MNDRQHGLIAFGSNVGDSESTFEQTVENLRRWSDLSVIAASQPIRTEPVGGESQARYLNAAIRIATTLPAAELMERLLDYENRMGRCRGRRWGPRTLDLDLLILGDQIVETDDLTLPHPRMTFRRFVLEPAAEIGGDLIHPLAGCTLNQLLACLDRRGNRIGIVYEVDHPRSVDVVQQLVGWRDTWMDWEFESFFSTEVFSKNWDQINLMVILDWAGSGAIAPKSANSDWASLRSKAVHFAGPTLRLVPDQRSVNDELAAALQAMA